MMKDADYTGYQALSESFDALTTGIENESICFESHVFGKPFLPKDSVESDKVFSRYCAEIDSFLAPGEKLQHYCWMGSTKTLSSSVFLEHGPEFEERRISLGRKFNNPLLKRVIPAITRGRIWGITAVSTPSLVPEEGILILSAYLVFHDEQFEELQNEKRELSDHDMINFWRGGPWDWKNRFIYCRTFALPALSTIHSPEVADEVIRDLIFYSAKKSLVFESYHLISGFPPEMTISSADCKLQVLRLRTMQFQREWGQREKVSEAKKEALLTIGHEFKNALEETLWLQLLRDIVSGRSSYEDVKTQQRIERCLSHLLWPQSLAVVIRSVAKFEEGDKLRTKWLDKEALPFKPTEVLSQFKESIRYLINYIVSRYSESNANDESDPIKVVEASETELNEPATFEDLARRAEAPPLSEKFLDVERLFFPPLRLDGSEGYAPAFAIVSLLVEPIRNACKYVTKQRAHLPAGFIAWSVSAADDGVDVLLVNPIAENDQMPHVVSTGLVSRLGGWLGIGSISSKGPGKVMVSLRPHLLKKQPGE
jgi:hypothetical protein